MTENKTGERAGETGNPAVAPFPPERPADDARPETQKIQEARATDAALAGEHGNDGPPQYVDAPAPHGHNAGDYDYSAQDGARPRVKAKAGDGKDDDSKAEKSKADEPKADEPKAEKPKAEEPWRDKGSAASR